MRMYVVYEKPRDYPDSYVVRGWTIGPGSVVADAHLVAMENTLEDARKYIPNGLQHMVRAEDDDPVIVEVWI